MKNRTIDVKGAEVAIVLCHELYNPEFKPLEFEGFGDEAGASGNYAKITSTDRWVGTTRPGNEAVMIKISTLLGVPHEN